MSIEQWAAPQDDNKSIERIPQNSPGDVTASLAEIFQHLEDRIDATEAHICSRLSDLENLLAQKTR